MAANYISGCNVGNGVTEIQTVAYIGHAAHGLVCRTVTFGGCLIYGKGVGQSSAACGRKLALLVNNANYCVGITGTKYPVHYYSPYCQLAFIGFATGLAVNQVGQEITVTLSKLNLGNITPCRVLGSLG